MQSRSAQPQWLEQWLDKQIQFDALWEKGGRAHLHNMSLLMERSFASVQSSTASARRWPARWWHPGAAPAWQTDAAAAARHLLDLRSALMRCLDRLMTTFMGSLPVDAGAARSPSTMREAGPASGRL